MDERRSFKSLDAYNYFMHGWLNDVVAQCEVAPPTEECEVAPPTEECEVAPPIEECEVAPPVEQWYLTM